MPEPERAIVGYADRCADYGVPCRTWMEGDEVETDVMSVFFFDEVVDPDECLRIFAERTGVSADTATLFTGFDGAICGCAVRRAPVREGDAADAVVFVYSWSRILEILAEDMGEEDALEWISVNMEGSWVGAATPFVLHPCEDELLPCAES